MVISLHVSRRFRWLATAAGLLALAALAGCTTLGHALPEQADAGCLAWTAQLDAAVESAGVADAEAERLPGLAGLRVDRVSAALRDEAARSPDAWAAWLHRAAALDAAAREAKIANLPRHVWAAWPLAGVAGVADRAEALAKTDACRQRLLTQLKAPAQGSAEDASRAQALQAAVLQQAQVPARYSTALRALGLYPLVRWPFFAGVQAWQAGHSAEMARWAQSPPALQRHVPAAAAAAGGSERMPLWPPALDALGMPQPGPEEAERLLAWHAPVFDVQVQAPHDQFGRPGWGPDGRPRVDGSTPVVYQRLAHTRWRGRWHLQLVYTLWFSERPASGPLDLLAGALDGVVVRITLDEQGQPMLLDSMHACGCYHQFFPSPALQPRPGAPRSQEWLFAPRHLPALAPGERLVVQLASATHYLMGVQTVARGGPPAPGLLTYAVQDEAALRSLPTAAGRRSLYGPDGLVAGTQRGERFLFWPMGIASAGAMRQWGHHATAFVGRRHFDDPDLLELRFQPAGQAAAAGPAAEPL